MGQHAAGGGRGVEGTGSQPAHGAIDRIRGGHGSGVGADSATPNGSVIHGESRHPLPAAGERDGIGQMAFAGSVQTQRSDRGLISDAPAFETDPAVPDGRDTTESSAHQI